MAEPKPYYIDGHCHLADPRLDDTRDEVIERAKSQGIQGFIQGGVGPEDWDRQVTLKRRYPQNLHLCFGLHPWWVAANSREACQAALKKLPEYLSQAVAVGEIGLDHAQRCAPDTYPLQEELFRAQLSLARGRNLPVVLHIVHAHDRAVAILKEIGLPARGGIVHAFGRSWDVARQYLDLELHISLGGMIARSGYTQVKKAIAQIPADRLILESDAPDQPPPGFEGRLNEPTALFEVAEAVGQLRGQEPEQILLESRRQLVNLFGLPEIA